jgi:hypothetical protein
MTWTPTQKEDTVHSKETKSRRHTHEDKWEQTKTNKNTNSFYKYGIIANSWRRTAYNAGKKHKNNIEYYIKRQQNSK